MPNELLEKLKNFQGFNSDMLYNELILLDKKSSFDKLEFVKFIMMASSIIDGSLDKFVGLMDKIDDSFINDTNYAKILSMSNNLGNSGWIGVQSPALSEKKSETEPEYIKIYLSVDNSSLHHFANKIVLACTEKGYDDFDFKINKNMDLNRRDNVVFYCTKDNFGKYVDLINKVIEQNPNIVFNASNLLAIPYDEHITCSIDPNKNQSYTDSLCEGIFAGLKNGKSPEELVSSIESYKTKEKYNISSLKQMSSGQTVK